MGDTTTIRVSRQTHGRITRLAQQRNETIDQTVDRALRALRQLSMGRELSDKLTDEDKALEANLAKPEKPAAGSEWATSHGHVWLYLRR